MAEASSTPSAAGIPNQERGILHVRELGLTQIDGHPNDHPFVADVVFIHGLQGHPQETWQSKSPAKPRKRLRDRFKKKALSAKDGETQQHDRLFWPADLLTKDFKDIRILTYGYDSMITKALTGPTSKNGIFHHGKSLLGALSRVRLNCGDRPIIFVAHSLGGLLVKQALIEARKTTNDSSILQIYNNSYGVIFFGTPHRGSDMASWGLLLKNIAQVALMDTNDAILTDLDPKSGSSKLEELRLDFDDVLRDGQRAQELRVFSFQEEQGMTGVSLLGGKVVPNESSSLDSRKYGSDTIHANHMGMCRFDDENDDGYEKFSGVLRRFIAEIKGEKSNAQKTSLESDATRRAVLLQNLDYAERSSRENQIQNTDAKEESFCWIWQSSSFFEWWWSREGLYWISGKPGSGKSTLMEYLFNEYNKYNEYMQGSQLQQFDQIDWIVLHFFFDFRAGKGVTNTFEGLLRSLLYQLIEKIPLVIDGSETNSVSSCSEHMLRSHLRKTLENAKKGVCIFVDGLDEYEGSILAVINYLKNLVKTSDSGETSVKVCISSRPEPIPSYLLQGVPQLFISDHNQLGIQQYCQLTLETVESMAHDDLDVYRLSNVVARRAEGVFLWARFALEQIILGHACGETNEELLERLDEIPGEVEGIYDRMLSRMEPIAKKECMIMLQLVCFACEGLLWQELLVATDLAMGKELVTYERLCGDEHYSNFAKRLRAKAVGLLELVGDEQIVDAGKVKLIHRSVDTYLDQKGWQILGEPASIERVTHGLYVQICLRYLHRLLDRSGLNDCFPANNFQQLGRKPIAHFDDLLDAYPFLRYASTSMFRHAKFLERNGASSYPLIHGTLTERIFWLHKIFAGSSLSCWSCNACLRVPWGLITQDLDLCHMAYLHDLALYCKDDLTTRKPAPGQLFWERALRCAIYSYGVFRPRALETISLALQNATNVQQCHIESLSRGYGEKGNLELERLVLGHESVRNLRLVDGNGQQVTLFWSLNKMRNFDVNLLMLFIDVANSRGEDLREGCGPDGNVVETLLKQSPSAYRRSKLHVLREYYESQSWPFEWDHAEVEQYTESDASDDDDEDEDKDEEDEDEWEDEEWEDEEEQEAVERREKETEIEKEMEMEKEKEEDDDDDV